MMIVGALIVALGIQADRSGRRVAANIQILNQSRIADAEAALRIGKALGYNGFIYHFKNYVIRGDEESLWLAESFLNTATDDVSSALEREDVNWHFVVGASANEIRSGLESIAATLDEYRSALGAAIELRQTGNTARETDAIVRVSDVPAAAGLDILDRLAMRAAYGVGRDQGDANRPLLVARIHRSLGYVGAIHNFKNYVLRQDANFAATARENLAELQLVLNSYRNIDPSNREISAIAALQATMKSMYAALDAVEQMIAQGRSPEEIDASVVIDHASATAGLQTLENEMSHSLDENAGAIASTMHELRSLMTSVTWVTPLAFLLLILVSYWLVYIQLLKPLVGIAGAMGRIAADDLDVVVPEIHRKNEVGAVARWLETLRRNSLERRANEQALREQEERFRAVVDTAADGIVTIDEHGQILSFNSGAEAIFGYAADEVLGANVNVLMPEPYFSEHDDYLKNYRETGQPKIIGIGRELEGMRKDGTMFPLRLSVTGVDLSSGKIFAGIITEITAQKKTETELRQANDELEAFAYSVAHDLRGPLRWMNGFSERLVNDFGDQIDERARGYLDRIRAAATNMNHTIDALLKLARVGRAEPEIKRVDLSQLAREITSDIRDRDPGRHVDIRVDDDLMANADGELLRVALENLFGNAWKYTAQTPAAEIVFTAVMQKNGTKAFALRDNGAGFDMEHANKLFRAFERLHTGSEFQGTGIGLATAARVFARHGGKIWAESEVGQGSTFYFTL